MSARGLESGHRPGSRGRGGCFCHAYGSDAANLAILLFQTVATRPLLHTAQRLVSHSGAEAGTELDVTGTVIERHAELEVRNRDRGQVAAVGRASRRTTPG